jgi:hypothetical protein
MKRIKLLHRCARNDKGWVAMALPWCHLAIASLRSQ